MYMQSHICIRVVYTSLYVCSFEVSRGKTYQIDLPVHVHVHVRIRWQVGGSFPPQTYGSYLKCYAHVKTNTWLFPLFVQQSINHAMWNTDSILFSTKCWDLKFRLFWESIFRVSWIIWIQTYKLLNVLFWRYQLVQYYTDSNKHLLKNHSFLWQW